MNKIGLPVSSRADSKQTVSKKRNFQRRVVKVNMLIVLDLTNAIVDGSETSTDETIEDIEVVAVEAGSLSCCFWKSSDPREFSCLDLRKRKLSDALRPKNLSTDSNHNAAAVSLNERLRMPLITK